MRTFGTVLCAHSTFILQLACGGSAGRVRALDGLRAGRCDGTDTSLGLVPDVLERGRERIGVAKIVVSAVLTVVAGKGKTTTVALNYAPTPDDVLVADVA